jgi:hypothetical protein
MRLLIACLAVVAVMLVGNVAAPVAMAAAHSGSALSAAQQQPAQGKLDVNVNVGHNNGGGVWWQSPVWMAIGGIALVLLILVVVMMARGGGTTVVKG